MSAEGRPVVARFRYVGDEPRQVSILPAGTLRTVEPDELFEVPAEHADSYECQPHYFQRDDPAPRRGKAD